MNSIRVADPELNRYVAEVRRYPLLSREQEIELARRLRDHGDTRAAHDLVASNLRFVVKIANEYRGYGMRMLDLVQEGTVGLMHAVKRFNPERGYRLVTYAVFWIRAHIHEYIMRSWSLVKLGMGRVRRKLFFKLRAAEARASAVHGAEGSRAATAAELGVKETEFSEMQVRLAARDFALDAPVFEGEGRRSYVDLLSSDRPSQEEQLIARQEERLVQAAVQDAAVKLNEKERFILDHRLAADAPQSLPEIGRHFGISRERARQIEKRVLTKLRTALSGLAPAYAA